MSVHFSMFNGASLIIKIINIIFQ